MGGIKQLNIKNETYYFYNDIINIKNFQLSHVKILIFIISAILLLKHLLSLVIMKTFIV